jgi:hypothetical protein
MEASQYLIILQTIITKSSNKNRHIDKWNKIACKSSYTFTANCFLTKMLKNAHGRKENFSINDTGKM